MSTQTTPPAPSYGASNNPGWSATAQPIFSAIDTIPGSSASPMARGGEDRSWTDF
jgi:hypothetical protein